VTEKSIAERIEAILALQKAFDLRVESAETALLIDTLASWVSMQEKLYPAFTKLWKQFLEKEYIPLIESFIADMNKIIELNEAYFNAEVPAAGMLERLGVTTTGTIIREGYVHTVLQDQTVKRDLQKFISSTKQLKFDQKVKEDVTKLIKGEKAKPATKTTPEIPERPGVIKRFTDNTVKDTYNEADRVIQQAYSDVHFLDAGMYTGGLVENTRPFCKERNRHVFLRSEIALFGTPEDKFGGYSDKSIGMFNGKPKTGYDPFTMCGGYRCRHHWSYLANEYAVRIDKTLEEVDGKLRRI
jgi:hypothetical protein